MMQKRCYFIVAGLLFVIVGMAQRTVVADRVSRQPVEHANLYAKEGGKFRSVVADGQGRAEVTFPFHRLTVSHLNYEKQVLTRLPDTVFLEPLVRVVSEVTVYSGEPAWIRKKLKQFVREKEQRYHNRRQVLHYDYTSQSISGNEYYHYQTDGWLRMPSPDTKGYAIHPLTGHITSVDSTKLTDVANLRRMLYEDFVDELDSKFISQHRFFVDYDYEGEKNEVSLVFRGKKYTDDRGRFVIDTARCVILSAQRHLGLKANKHLRVSDFMLSMARIISGYKILDWMVDYRVTYAETDGSWHPADIAYKFFFKTDDNESDESSEEFTRETGGGFSNMESTVAIRSTDIQPDDSIAWKPLPRSWILKYNTDEERAYEVELSHLPATFSLMDARKEE